MDIWSSEASQGIGERAAAVKMCRYEGSNPNFIGEAGEAKMDQDRAEELAVSRLTDGSEEGERESMVRGRCRGHGLDRDKQKAWITEGEDRAMLEDTILAEKVPVCPT